MKKIVVFASGSGTNFQALIDAVHTGQIKAQIAGLITDRLGIKAIDRAKKNSIPVYTIPAEEIEQKLPVILNSLQPDLIVLAGYLKKVPSDVVQKYEHCIINIHPSLLPDYGGPGFYGMHVHRSVLQNREKESGCTVHYVTYKYDKGPIIEQSKVPVYKNDSPELLAKRILTEEHKLLPKVVKQILNESNKNH